MAFKKIFSAITLFVLFALLTACDDKTSETTSSEPTSQQKTFKWKLVTTWPKNFPGLGLAPENFATMVKEMSADRLQVRVYGSGEIVPAFEVFDAVSQGSAEMGHGAAYYWKGKHPASQFFTAVPFGMNAQEMNSWLHYGGGMALYQELYGKFNLIPFAGGNTGVQMGGWFNKKINSVEDLKGLKMRIPGLGGEVLKRLGGTPVSLPGGELYTSLQTGVIDATEWVGPYNDMAFGFQDIAKFYYYPGWHEPGAMLEFIVNKDAYTALPKDLQAIVKVATRAVNQDMLDEYTARNNAALKELIEKHGVKVIPFPDEVLKKIHEVSDKVITEVAASDELSARVYQSFKTFQDAAREYHRISEKAFLNKRDL